MYKIAVFLSLAALAAVFATFGFLADDHFLADRWSQLFWLTVSTMATSFVLQTILQYDERKRRRASDAFAFRAFTANMLNLLVEMCDLNFGDDLFSAALSGAQDFDKTADKVAHAIGASTAFCADKYHRYYLDISNGLRDLSRNYIRLFASTRSAMVQVYRELQQLAAKWGYKDELTVRHEEFTQSLREQDPDHQHRVAATVQARNDARTLLVQTANYLAGLAHKGAA
jgi:hypothetical protein